MLLFAILLVGMGGFVGSVSRFLLTGWIHRILEKPWFPYGTLAVNLIGCCAIGFLGGIAEERRIFSQEARLFVFIGLLGGFTTFSSFGYESMALMREAKLVATLLNVGLHIVLGLGAVWLGAQLARVF